MSLNTLSATEVLQRMHEFDTIIDARSEDEYAEDHLPGAINWPTLNNDERIEIGTLYKQVNPFEAKKRGAAIAARNIASHIEREVLDKPKDWKPLTYCWRGGKRSGSLSLVLGQIGFRVTLVEGGYKAFRAAMVADTASRVQQLHFQVVCGTTGSGKTRLLQALASLGAQVLDLEALACHRSSVLGAIPGVPQPSQKHFETRIWDTIRYFDPERPVYVESESKKVGNLYVPTPLVEHMRKSRCLNLQLSLASRVSLLLEDYAHMASDPDYFCNRLDALTTLRGKAVVNAWKEQVLAGSIAPVVQDLLTQHYDPTYLESMQRNFSQYDSAVALSPEDHSMQAMLEVAGAMLRD
jgi:tRNA 2-selenouridine synthase